MMSVNNIVIYELNVDLELTSNPGFEINPSCDLW